MFVVGGNVVHRVRQQLHAAVRKTFTSAEIILQECVTLWNTYRKQRYILSDSMRECCKIALENRFLPMLKLLLSQDGMSDYFDATDQRLMIAAVGSDFGEGVKFLHSKGGRLYKDCVDEVVKNNKYEVLKYILEHKDLYTNKTKFPSGLEPNVKGTNSEQIYAINQQLNPPEISALHCCIRGCGSTRHFVKTNQEQVLRCVKLLVEAGADINLRDMSGLTPVQLAAVYGMVTTVIYLVQKGAHFKRNTILHFLAQSKGASDSYDECVKLLLKKGMNIDQLNSQNKTPLHQAVQYNNVDMVKSLLNIKSTRHMSDKYGDKPLALAAGNNNIELVTLLISKYGDINHQNQCGETALHKAIAVMTVKIKYEVIDTGFFSSENWTLKVRKSSRFYLTERTIRSIIKILLKAGADVNLCDNNGRTALMKAALTCNRSGLQCLLDAGAGVNKMDRDGQTALMKAAQACDRSVLQCLLEAGADVNLCDNNGTTALMEAAKNCDRYILGSLLKAGADVNKTDINRRSAMYYVIIYGSDGPFSGSAMNAVRRGIHMFDTHLKPALQRVHDAYLKNCIYCLKLLLTRKCHVSLDTLFEFLLATDNADPLWYLVTENCSLACKNIRKVIDKLQFSDTVKLSQILFESGGPKREIERHLLISNWHSTYNPVVNDFRGFCKSRSLQSRCRRVIRKCIGSGIRSKITQLGLPPCLQDYVIMKDLIPEKYFTLVMKDDYDNNKYLIVDDNKDKNDDDIKDKLDDGKDDDDGRLDDNKDKNDDGRLDDNNDKNDEGRLNGNKDDDNVRLDDNKDKNDDGRLDYNKNDDNVRLDDNEGNNDDGGLDDNKDKNDDGRLDDNKDKNDDDNGDKYVRLEEEAEDDDFDHYEDEHHFTFAYPIYDESDDIGDDDEDGDEEDGDDEEDDDDDDDEDGDYSDDTKGEVHETFDHFIFDGGDDNYDGDDYGDGGEDDEDDHYSDDTKGDHETFDRFKFHDKDELSRRIFNKGTYKEVLNLLTDVSEYDWQEDYY